MPLTPAARTYQIKLTLEGIRPPIWRRLLVSSTITLKQFYRVLQIAMGWTDSHLHHFLAKGATFGPTDLDYGREVHDEASLRLDQVLGKVKDELRYEYDFGDDWRHRVVLEKIIAASTPLGGPRCVAGKRACPPEDCGGICGYARLVEAIGDPSHPEHEERLEWVGEEFDPDHFDVAEVEAALGYTR